MTTCCIDEIQIFNKVSGKTKKLTNTWSLTIAVLLWWRFSAETLEPAAILNYCRGHPPFWIRSITSQSFMPSTDVIQLTLILKMTTAQAGCRNVSQPLSITGSGVRSNFEKQGCGCQNSVSMVTGHDDCKMFPDHEILGKVAKIKRFWSKLFHFLVREGGGKLKSPQSEKGLWYSHVVFMKDG